VVLWGFWRGGLLLLCAAAVSCPSLFVAGSGALLAVALFTATHCMHAVCLCVCVCVFGWQQSAVCCCPVYCPLHCMTCSLYVCVCCVCCVFACLDGSRALVAVALFTTLHCMVCSVYVCVCVVCLRVWMAAKRCLLLPCLLPSPLHGMQFVCMCVLCVCVYLDGSRALCAVALFTALHCMAWSVYVCVCVCVCARVCVCVCLDGSGALLAVALFTALYCMTCSLYVCVCVVCVRVWMAAEHCLLLPRLLPSPLHDMQAGRTVRKGTDCTGHTEGVRECMHLHVCVYVRVCA